VDCWKRHATRLTRIALQFLCILFFRQLDSEGCKGCHCCFVHSPIVLSQIFATAYPCLAIRAESGEKVPLWNLVRIVFHLFLSIPSASVSCLSHGFPSQIQLGCLGDHCELPRSWSGCSPADKRFLVCSELKITVSLTAHAYTHIRTGTAAYRYAVSQKRNRNMVSSRPKKCRYGIPFHTIPPSTLLGVIDALPRNCA